MKHAQAYEGQKGAGGLSSRGLWQVAAWLACGAALVYAYWGVLRDLWAIWTTNQDYSYGVLVAPFAVALAWWKRDDLKKVKPKPSWTGALVLLVAATMRTWGETHYYDFLQRYSLVVAIWGIALLLGGWPLVIRRRPDGRIGWAPHLMAGPLLFLLLMIPLPGRVNSAITLPLQRLAAWTSAGVLNVMGWDAISEGNLIRMYGQDLEVAAACNGLRMVFAIVTLGCAIAYLSQRPPWERITVACSTVVIGVAANVARIVVSGIVSQVLVGAISTGSAHDVAGWLMIPFALILIWCEQRFLGSLFIEGPAEAGARYT